MTKILNPKECLRRFIEGKIQHNRDLYEAGLKNLYFEWESFGNDILNQSDLLDSYVQECGELRMANESLKKDIERLSKYRIEYDNIIKDKIELLKQLESLKQDALENLKSMPNELKEIFQKDVHALKIVIDTLKRGLNSIYGQNTKEVEQ